MSGLHPVRRAEWTQGPLTAPLPQPPSPVHKETTTCSPCCPLCKENENPSTNKFHTVILTFQLMDQLGLNARQRLSRQESSAELQVSSREILSSHNPAMPTPPCFPPQQRLLQSPEGQHHPVAHRKHAPSLVRDWADWALDICSKPGTISLYDQWRKANAANVAVHQSTWETGWSIRTSLLWKCPSLALTLPLITRHRL